VLYTTAQQKQPDNPAAAADLSRRRRLQTTLPPLQFLPLPPTSPSLHRLLLSFLNSRRRPD
jgi:hypothetical protein